MRAASRGGMNGRLFAWVLASCALVIACGSGGADPSTSTSATNASSSGGSSGGGSSGTSVSTSSSSSGSSSGGSSGEQPVDCGATCLAFAEITFDEPNTNGALDSALVDACRAGVCVHGQVTTNAQGTRFLSFEPDAKGASDVIGSITELTAGPLRFDVRWTLPDDINVIQDGEIYTVEARAQAGGATLFSRSFTAAYQTMTICGGTCKQWREGP
jgi:hypothetical protein